MSTMTLEHDLLASYLDDGGWHCEAENVRQGVDLESYEIELRLIDWLNRHTNLAQPKQAVDVGVIRALVQAWRTRIPANAGDSARVLMRESCADQLEAALTRAISGEKAGPVDGWISVKERLPERNKPAIYWHKSEFGGFAAIADEWRDKHHLQYATHWMPYVAPASPAPDKEGGN